MDKKIFVIKDETRKRCQIIPLDEKTQRQFAILNLEQFHMLYDADKIGFSVYFRAGGEMIEFMRPEELSKELLDAIFSAMKKDFEKVEVCIKKKELPLFYEAIEKIRTKKINALLEKAPELDRKTLELFGNLSSASQMVVRGGLSSEVAGQVSASAANLVNNLMDSEVAIGTLSKMVNCDPTLYDHSASVAMIAGIIATRVLKKPLTKKEAELVSSCGLYHDVGKTCVPNAVLNKPGKFTPAEYEVMKTHTTLGNEELIKAIESGAPIDPLAARVALEHHERFCGQGYPHGRMGRLEDDPKNGIHLYTRIVTIADVYSALLMKRVYKPAFESHEAIKIMAECAEKEYDPDIFNPFLKDVIKSLNFYNQKEKNGPKGRILMIENGKVKVS